MDWALAIKINQTALTRIVAALFAMLGLAEGGAIARLPREVHRAAMQVLIPAESAVRRLIIIAARGVVVELRPSRPAKKKPARAGKKGGANRLFQLVDTRKRFGRPSGWHRKGPKAIPRIRSIPDPRLVPLFHKREDAPARDFSIGANSLCRRLAAIKAALEDLQGQAKRLARWQARRRAMERPKFTDPRRPGRPPGYRKEPKHDVDHVLIECDWLARDALRADTS
jgi:hypothetical protein